VIEITPELSIPESELQFLASRAGGPGGQHVNKVSSRVTLRFDLWASPSLDEEQKRRIAQRLATRITKEGVLTMHARRHRSQAMNREELVGRFTELLREALRPRRARRKTRPSRAVKERRLSDKRRRGEQKRLRSKRHRPDD
jgi:ribosome-associated protein